VTLRLIDPYHTWFALLLLGRYRNMLRSKQRLHGPGVLTLRNRIGKTLRVLFRIRMQQHHLGEMFNLRASVRAIGILSQYAEHLRKQTEKQHFYLAVMSLE
jgi:hypothetical protein